MARRYQRKDGHTLQAFRFALDPTTEQREILKRQCGGRRFAYNWALAKIKEEIHEWSENGTISDPPTFYSMRKKWNQEKEEICINRETGEIWHREVSKEAFASGIHDVVDGYWRWQKSKSGKIAGRRVGFPRFKKRGKDKDRYKVSTGLYLSGRRHAHIPKVGKVRLHENARRLERLLSSDRGKVLSSTISRSGDKWFISFQVDIIRPQQPGVALPDSVVGVDVGVRTLAVIGSEDGTILEHVKNPRPLENNMKELRRLNRQLSRRTLGSSRYLETRKKINALHRRISNIRSHHIHKLTTHLAKTHGTIVVEKLNMVGMLGQKGLPGSRSRRRGLSDSALSEIRRQLQYKTEWYGSRLIEADTFFPSSKTCHRCGNIQTIGWLEHWACEGCSFFHQRDENAAINLARYSGDLSPVGAPVKRGADSKTPYYGAVGRDPRKQSNIFISEQPRDGVLV